MRPPRYRYHGNLFIVIAVINISSSGQQKQLYNSFTRVIFLETSV